LKFLASLILALISLSPILAQDGQPQLVVGMGHVNVIGTLACSPDGKYLASGSGDNKIKIWSVETGTELRSINAHTKTVASISISPDGRFIASGGNDDDVKIWSVVSGELYRSLKGHTNSIESVAFSPDGKTVASGSSDKTIKIWDVATGSELRTLVGHTRAVVDVLYTNDGTNLVSAGGFSTIRIWDIASGSEIRTLTGQFHDVSSLKLSRDGTTLAAGTDDGSICIWNIASGELKATLKEHSDAVLAVEFSADGKLLTSGGVDSKLLVWDVAGKNVVKIVTDQTSPVYSMTASPDGSSLVTGDSQSQIKIRNIRTWEVINTFSGGSSWPRSVAISPDIGKLALGGNDYSIKVWNLLNGQEPMRLEGHKFFITCVNFDTTGQSIASASFDTTVKIWDAESGRNTKTFSGYNGNSPAIFSPDGQKVAFGGFDNTVEMWDVAAGNRSLILTGHTDIVFSLSFSPDGKTLASGSDDGTIKIWNSQNGRLIKTLQDGLDWVRSLAYSPDGETIAAAGWNGVIEFWNVKEGRLLRSVQEDGNPAENALAFEPDGKTLVSGYHDGSIKAWNVADAKLLRTYRPHTDSIFSVAFSANGKVLASAAADGTIRLSAAASGNELATLAAFEKADWIATTPDGFFDGSPAAWKQLIWRFNNNTFDYVPMESYFNDFFYPNLLQDVLAGKSPKPRAGQELSNVDRRQPKIAISSAGLSSDNRNLKVKIDVTDNTDKTAQAGSAGKSSGARDVRLFRNGSLVKVWRGDVLKGIKSATLETTVSVVAGDNNLTAYAFNRDNVKSVDAKLTVKGAESLKRKGTSYLLTIGVNQYANAQFDLKYAVPDATDFAAEFKLRQEKLGKFGKVEVVSLINRDATKINILKTIAAISTKIQPEDMLVIYFAGHGTARQNRFYLLPHDHRFIGQKQKLDPTSAEADSASGISDDELQETLETIDAKTFLIIDACNSGQALEAEEKRRGPMNSRGLAQLAYEKGMFILAAAQSQQAALEISRLGHGLLTYALLEGLEKADQNASGEIIDRKWLDYAVRTVPELQLDEMRKRSDQIKKDPGKRGAELVFVNGDDKNLSPEKRGLQTPRIFYRRELEAFPLVVSRP
jgi:WD40 repeat protein